MFTCDLYAGSPPPHDLERLRTTMQRRVVDFVRIGYFIPLNGPLNGHPPSLGYIQRYSNIIIIFDMVLSLKQKKLTRQILNLTESPSFHFGMNHQGLSTARLKCPAYADRKISLSEKIVLLLHPHVWLLRNLSLDGELCFPEGKNADFYYKFTISRHCRQDIAYILALKCY